MALIKCIECGKEISNKAIACPSCGNPVENRAIENREPVDVEQEENEVNRITLGIFEAAAIAFILGLIGVVGFFSYFAIDFKSIFKNTSNSLNVFPIIFIAILLGAALFIKPLRKTAGLLLVILGGLACFTLIGLIIGIPMIILGGIFLFI